jgi:hypothetical protein
VLIQYPQIEGFPVFDKVSGWARAGLCPYALPIGAAALLIAPEMFGKL